MENSMANFVLPGYVGNIFSSASGLVRQTQSPDGCRQSPDVCRTVPSTALQDLSHVLGQTIKTETTASEACSQNQGDNLIFSDASANKHAYYRGIQVPAFLGAQSVPTSVSFSAASNLKQFAVIPAFDLKQYVNQSEKRPASALDNPISHVEHTKTYQIPPSTASLPVFPDMNIDKSTFVQNMMSNISSSSASTVSGLTRPMSAGPAYSRQSADSIYPAPHLLYVSKTKALETLDAAIGEYFETKTQVPLTTAPAPTGSLPTLATVAKMMEHTYKCSECEFSSDFKDKVDIHMCIHSGIKPYKCIKCNYTSNRRDKLVIHVRSHTGEKPFKCTICNYATVRKDRLVMHTRMHTGEKPYKCDQCDHACTRRDKLVIHKRTHNGEKPYRCYSCDFMCSRRDRLVKHMKIHSSVVLSPVIHNTVEHKPLELSRVEHKSDEHNRIVHNAVEHNRILLNAVEHSRVEHKPVEHSRVELNLAMQNS